MVTRTWCSRCIRITCGWAPTSSFTDLVAALGARPVAGSLLMCSSPEAISAGLPLLRAAYGGVTGAYANLGYNPTGPVANRPVLSNQRPSSGPDIIQAADHYPSRIAGFASEWLGIGAQIVGGCCASGPEHIAAIRRVVSVA